jgi:hypothetical protein
VAPGPTATDLFLDGKDEAAIERFAKLKWCRRWPVAPGGSTARPSS